MPRPRLLGATVARSLPSSKMRPRSTGVKPAIICKVVVLPQPEGPSSETNSPRSTARSSPAMTVTSPKDLPKPSRTRCDMDAIGNRVEGGQGGQGCIRAARSALDLAVPAPRPFLTLGVGRIPVERLERPGLPAIRQAPVLLRRQYHPGVGRTGAVTQRQRHLHRRREHVLQKGIRLDRVLRPLDRAA